MNRPAPMPCALPLLCAVALAACSSREDAATPGPAATRSAAATTDDGALSGDRAAPPVATGTSPSPPAGPTLALEGVGDLVIGRPVPAGSSFAERGAQIGEDCRTVSSPAFPGVYAITRGRGGRVRRITVSERSKVRLAEGIGLGAIAQEVLSAFPGLRATPHKYVSAPGRYLTQPGSDPRLRFEIGENGRVGAIHVGPMPELGYVEGCA